MAVHRETGHTLEHINLGGGIPVNYLRDPQQVAGLPRHERDMLGAELEPADVLAAALRAAGESAEMAGARHLLENVTILLEPGRSVIADAGLVLTTVRNIKRRLRRLIRALRRRIPAPVDEHYNGTTLHLCSTRLRARRDRYKVPGLCDSGDVYFDIERMGRLPDYRRLPADVRPGETLALLNSGAYSLAQMFPYNGRPLPSAVMVREDGHVHLIRRRDSYDDLIASDVW